jgi:hypothetical protein
MNPMFFLKSLAILVAGFALRSFDPTQTLFSVTHHFWCAAQKKKAPEGAFFFVKFA